MEDGKKTGESLFTVNRGGKLTVRASNFDIEKRKLTVLVQM